MKRLTATAPLFLILSLAGLASAQETQYFATLSGAAEDDPNTSPGTGTAIVTLNLDQNTMRVQTEFANLEGTTTASHIHCCTTEPLTGAVGVATPVPTFPDFPLGGMEGTYDHTFDLLDPASYNPSFLSANGGTAEGARLALVTGLNEGRAYLNIHSNVYGGGEIRGFLVVPEPSSCLVALTGLIGLALLRRSRGLG